MDDLTLFTTQVHAIKSASAALGALEISKAASSLEAACKTKDLEFIRRILPGFIKNLEKLLEAVCLYTNEAQEENEWSEKPETVNPLPLLNYLLTALDGKNLDAIDGILDELNRLNPGNKVKKALEKISDAVLLAEFEEAVKTVKSIQA
jgi:hypothetical protein